MRWKHCRNMAQSKGVGWRLNGFCAAIRGGGMDMIRCYSDEDIFVLIGTKSLIKSSNTRVKKNPYFCNLSETYTYQNNERTVPFNNFNKAGNLKIFPKNFTLIAYS